MSSFSVSDYLAASAAERVIQVDEKDQPLGVVTRAQAQNEGLITRCTYIFVFNSAGLLCMHKRTLHKRLYPGYWDVAAGGVVGAGESYLEGAQRELAEEFGISNVPLQDHGRFFFQSAESRLWGGVFSCLWDGEVQMQPEEVLALRWISLAAAWQKDDEDYTPDSLQALELLPSGYRGG